MEPEQETLSEIKIEGRKNDGREGEERAGKLKGKGILGNTIEKVRMNEDGREKVGRRATKSRNKVEPQLSEEEKRASRKEYKCLQVLSSL